MAVTFLEVEMIPTKTSEVQTPTKRIIKLKGQELYFLSNGRWTKDIGRAQQFAEEAALQEAIERHGLDEIEFVSVYEHFQA